VHILILADRDWTHPQAGGSGSNLLHQVRHWLDWGHRVSVIASGYPGAKACLRDGALTMHHVGGRSTVFPHAIARQWRGLVPDPDVVLEVINGITFLTPLWLREPRLALVHHIHRGRHYTEELGRLGTPAALVLETAPLRMLYGRTRFMAVSDSTARDLALHGVPEELIDVNRNGAGGNGYRAGRKAKRPTVLYLGRLKRYKHVERLLDVAEALPMATLEIAGEGDARPALEEAIAARGLAGGVRLHGFVDEHRKIELLQRAWVHVTASVAEGWSLTVMEAAACGTPSVALAAGGLPESIVDGRTGLLARDEPELVAHTRMLVEDAALRERLGEGALERAGRFSWTRTAERTLELLEAAREEAAPAHVAGPAVAAGLTSAAMLTKAMALTVTPEASPSGPAGPRPEPSPVRAVPDPEPAEPLVSVLVPAYNEAETIAEVVQGVAALPLRTEIVVVDDGSVDGTGVVLEALVEAGVPGLQVIRNQRNRGKGASVRTALAASHGDVVVVQDADLEYDPRELPRLVEPIVDGRADVVYGTRLRGGGEPQRAHMFWHYAGNRFLSLVTNVLYNTTISDMEVGHKAFRGDLIRSIELRSNGFGFEPEVTAKLLRRRRVRLYEMPIAYYGRTYDEGKKATWRDGVTALALLVRHRL
jgi:glycosyltransferase involved in cell wall biosynthesis